MGIEIAEETNMMSDIEIENIGITNIINVVNVVDMVDTEAPENIDQNPVIATI